MVEETSTITFGDGYKPPTPEEQERDRLAYLRRDSLDMAIRFGCDTGVDAITTATQFYEFLKGAPNGPTR